MASEDSTPETPPEAPPEKIHARQPKLAAFRRAYTQLTDALNQFPLQMWGYKPGPDQWSIQEIVHHIADSEANGYVRLRKCLAEPGQAVMAYDGQAWAQALHYQEKGLEEALELFRWLRLQNARLISNLPEEAWESTYIHPEHGTLTLEDWLATYESHIPDHIEQMWAVYREWVERQW